MQIRRAKKSDFESYVKLRKESLLFYIKLTREKLKLTPKQIKEEFFGTFSPKRQLFFAEEAGEIVGFIMGTFVKNSYQKQGYIDDIYVARGLRKKGVGQKLMLAFEKWAKQKGAKTLRLGVRTNNQRAINFYKNLGFEIFGYDMEKRLKA